MLLGTYHAYKMNMRSNIRLFDNDTKQSVNHILSQWTKRCGSEEIDIRSMNISYSLVLIIFPLTTLFNCTRGCNLNL